DDARFFFAATGAYSAEAELQATLNAASEPISDDLNQHPLCRFPARYRWLEGQGLVDRSVRQALSCPEYQQWRTQVNATRLSLIFPAAYMNSPSSMYGHTFLRFDPADAEAGSLWLSWALNFGANITTDDNSLFYVYKGLFGGYPGQFNMMPYYRKIQEYNRMENRDMWEYPLNLTAAEVDQLLEHVWELKEINFDYFFFDENCSFQLLELLDLIRPDAQLTEGFDLHAIPADTVRAVVDAGIAGEVIYRPANRTRFDALSQSLSEQERQTVIRLSQTPLDPGELFDQQSPQRQQLLAQAGYDYLRLQQDGAVRDPDANRRSYQLLQMINARPSEPLAEPAMPTDPVDGHYSGLLRAGVGQRDHRNYGLLGYRIAYQDLLDADEGFPRGAELAMGELALRHYAGGTLKLELLELLSIRSFSPRDALFKPWSWQVKAGLERVYSNTEHPDNLVAQVTGGGGVSYGFNQQQSTLFGLLTGRFEINDRFSDPLAVGLGANLGLRHDFGPLQALAETELMQLSSGSLRRQFELGGQYNLTPQQGVRASWSYRRHDDGQQDNSVTLEYRHYLQ
ncbi:MAG: DUF4105 domain-containing protein, partial [Halopseudomonas sp.]